MRTHAEVEPRSSYATMCAYIHNACKTTRVDTTRDGPTRGGTITDGTTRGGPTKGGTTTGGSTRAGTTRGGPIRVHVEVYLLVTKSETITDQLLRVR